MTEERRESTTCQHNQLCVNPNCSRCFPGLNASLSSSLREASNSSWSISSSYPPLLLEPNVERILSADLVELPLVLCSSDGTEKRAIKVLRCCREDKLADIRSELLLANGKGHDGENPPKSFSFLKSVGGRILKLTRDQEGGRKGYKAKHFDHPQQKHQLRICSDDSDDEVENNSNDSHGLIEFCVRHIISGETDDGLSNTLGMIRLYRGLSIAEIREEIAEQLPKAPSSGRFVRLLQGEITLITPEQESGSCKNPLYAYHFAPPYTNKPELILMTSKSYTEGEVVQDETKNRELKSLAFPLNRQGKNPRDVVKGKATQYMNAFLNCSGGVLIFGANDDGVIERVPISGKKDSSEMSLDERVKLARSAKDDIRKLIDAKARTMDPTVDDDLISTQFVPVRSSSEVDDRTRDAEDEIYCVVEVHCKIGRRSIYFVDKDSFDAYERRDGSTFLMDKANIMQCLKPFGNERIGFNGGWRQLQSVFDFEALMRRLSDPWAGREWLFAEMRQSLFELSISPTPTPTQLSGIAVIASRGMGKTAFLSELVLRPKSVTGIEVIAHHLCCSDDPDTLNPALFVHSVAAMLAHNCKEYRNLMVESQNEDKSDLVGAAMLRSLRPEHCESDPDDAFLRGVLEPLRYIEECRRTEKIKQSLRLPKVIVIDALDESLAVTMEHRPGRSGSSTVAQLLERAFSSNNKHLPSSVKFVVSYRADTNVPLIQRLGDCMALIDLDKNDTEKQRQRATNDILLFEHAYIERKRLQYPGQKSSGDGHWDFTKSAAFSNKSGRSIYAWEFEVEPGRWVPFDDRQNMDLLYAWENCLENCVLSSEKDTFRVNVLELKQCGLKSGIEENIRMVLVTSTGERIPCSLAEMANCQNMTETNVDSDNGERDLLQILASKSAGNYLYARTVLEDIRSGHLQWKDVSSLPSGLELLYDNFFKRYDKGSDIQAKPSRVVQPVLEVLLAAHKYGVTEREIIHAVVAGSAADPAAVEFCLRDIQWALEVDNSRGRPRYKLQHESIRNFLREASDQARALRCREDNGHMLLAASLLQRCWPQQLALSKWIKRSNQDSSSSFDWHNWNDWSPNTEDGDVFNLAAHLSLCNVGSEEERISLLKTIGKDLLNNVFQGKGTALHGASFVGNVSVVKLLLCAGASPNVLVKGKAPLHFAAGKGFSATVSLLLDAGANVALADQRGRTPLLAAASRGSPTTVKHILKAIAMLEKKVGHDLIDSSLYYSGRTSLSLSVEEGHDSIVLLLLEAGASVTIADQDQRSPLYYAARFGRVASNTVKSLVAAPGGKDALECGSMKRSPLHVAVWHGHIHVVQALLESGADPSIVDENGSSALHTCFQSTCLDKEVAGLDILSSLLKSKRCRVNQRDACGCTPLWYGVGRGWTEAVQVLLDYGALIDPERDSASLPNKSRRGPSSPLLLALKRQHYATATCLVERGALLPPDYELHDLVETPGIPSQLIDLLQMSNRTRKIDSY